MERRRDSETTLQRAGIRRLDATEMRKLISVFTSPQRRSKQSYVWLADPANLDNSQIWISPTADHGEFIQTLRENSEALREIPDLAEPGKLSLMGSGLVTGHPIKKTVHFLYSMYGFEYVGAFRDVNDRVTIEESNEADLFLRGQFNQLVMSMGQENNIPIVLQER